MVNSLRFSLTVNKNIDPVLDKDPLRPVSAAEIGAAAQSDNLSSSSS